jgi:hypothetical protein
MEAVMELLNISVTLDNYGRGDLDVVAGRDVSYQPYPGPDTMDLIRGISALVCSVQADAGMLMSDTLQTLLKLPGLLTSLSEGVQDLIDASEILTVRQLALFS